MSDKDLLSKLAAHLITRTEGDSNRTSSERELAEFFGVSRGQVREALAILEAWKIVERRAKSGIYLTTKQASVEALALLARAGLPLDPIEIQNAVELRKIHEIKAAELAAERALPENIDRLRTILAATEQRLQEGEPIHDEDREFHLEIVHATQNALFYRVVALYYVMGAARAPIYFSDPVRAHQSHLEHQQIFEAITKHNGKLASALMDAHLLGVESYWKGLIGTPEQAKPAILPA